MQNLWRNPNTAVTAAWCAVLLLTIGIYCIGLPGYWVFDDFTSIVNNDALSYQIGRAHV